MTRPNLAPGIAHNSPRDDVVTGVRERPLPHGKYTNYLQRGETTFEFDPYEVDCTVAMQIVDVREEGSVEV